MGLLDSTAGTITVDAVLTDIGRAALARNDGGFEIVRYSFGDDEINYSLFQPNTGSLQQDANILNTPIFEANVNEKIALKYQLLSISNPDLKYMPTLSPSVSTLPLGERTDSQVGKTISFSQITQAGRVVPNEVVDTSFIFQMNNDLLYMQSQAPVNLTPYGTAQYIIPRATITANQGAQVSCNIAVQSLPNDLWNAVGVGTVGSRVISTTVRCQGALSGMVADINIQISEEFVRTT